MRLPTMLVDILGSLVRRPATRQYPSAPSTPPPRLRGRVHWDPQRCTGCRLCVMDCPASALELFTLDKAAHRFVLRYDAARCTFCSQCVESCNHGSIWQANDEWELAGPDRQAFIAYYGADDDVEQILAGEPQAAPSAE